MQSNKYKEMKKLLSIILCLLAVSLSSLAQEQGKPLRFRKNGEFRIMQLTDTHYKWGKSASNAVTDLITEMISTEDVDLVVFTGDNVYAEGVENALRVQLKPFDDNKTPFIALFGNHDHQFEITQQEQWDIFRSFAYNVQPDRPAGESYPDFVLPILSSNSNRVAQLIYNFDSHAGYKTRAISRYDWLGFDQIAWYRQQSKRYTRENGGKPLPAITFLHIPLPEYAEAFNHYSGGNKKKTGIPGVVGTRGENECCPKLNSGMFASMLECGDVRGVFCGHDHDNDYALVWKNIMLAYGHYSGGNTVYNNIGKNGVRIIVLHEDNRNIDTYIRLRGGEKINPCTYPTDF